MCILGKISCLADLVFDPTLAFARFAEDLLLRYAMITACLFALAAYVDPFARTWLGFSTTDLSNLSYFITGRRSKQGKKIYFFCSRAFQRRTTFRSRSSRSIYIVYQQYTFVLNPFSPFYAGSEGALHVDFSLGSR